jgi:membrane fusion protein
MKNNLFRDEALQIDNSRSHLGGVIISAPISHRILTYSILLLATLALLYLCLGTYTRREHVAGFLVSGSGLIEINADSAGKVEHIFVHEGQSVKKGDKLVRISTDHGNDEGAAYLQINDQLSTQKTRIYLEIENQKQTAETEEKDLSNRVRMLSAEIPAIDDQLILQKSIASSAEKVLKKMAPGAISGVVSTLQYEEEKQAQLGSEQQVSALERQALDLRQQLAALKAQLAESYLSSKNAESALARQAEVVDETQIQNGLMHSTVIYAPQDGLISSLVASPGEAVITNQKILDVTPTNATYEARFLVPSTDVGFLKAGQHVAIHYQAYAYQKFGVQWGQITDVSLSALKQSDAVQLIGSNQITDPSQASIVATDDFYKVDVSLEHQQITAYGMKHHLEPGMAISADIMLEKRTLLEWILEPLFTMKEDV